MELPNCNNKIKHMFALCGNYKRTDLHITIPDTYILPPRITIKTHKQTCSKSN